MLQFSIERVCTARGIPKPYKFLVRNGFLPTTATKLAKGDVEYLRVEYLEKLCTLLNCVPNDLFEWIPDTKADDRPDHPLFPIRQADKLDFAETFKNLPMSKLREIEAIIANLK
ncbi:MAG TPA: helix-turn-helix transcriptional regulator [Catalimonadaceae bacterium]|mgnify:CR=1 FL=1|nr:helix-turn-helix transcriptional regulator [Catalimonadaceae bacterium]HPI11279.1 helix-turn-helix transcriptional regulator [Catalimonadaceae bacterium]